MPHQCLAQRAAFTAPSPSATWCLRIVGWYRLERLLASIPDSNDDFGLV
ncbi:hypothetical protein [Burkholderia sp. LMG 13014]|nr:hypothetical protein [Burkholderia sp. LMG 13014]